MNEILGSIVTIEDDSYDNKAFKKVTLATGQVLKVKQGREGALKDKWGILSEGAAVKFIMTDFTKPDGVKIPFVSDIEAVKDGLAPAVNPNETKIPQQDEADKTLAEARAILKQPDPRGDPKSSGKNRSFALAYIKDIVVALINARTIEKMTPAMYAEMLERAESWAKWLDG